MPPAPPQPLKIALRVALSAALVWALYSLRASAWARAYPLAVCLAAFSAFALSLRPGRTPLVETFARRMGEDLDDAGLRYCRSVTVVWAVFLALHSLVTAATLFLSPRVWAWYNGCVAYALFGTLFTAEWIVRRRMRHGRVR